MTRESYYSDVKIIKKPLKQRVKNIFKIFLFFVLVVGCFWGAKGLSKALTVGNLGALIVYGDTKVKLEETSYYAVTLGEYNDKIEAERVGLGAMVQGAGGYVWENDGKYFVIGNVYKNYSDASKVVSNLKDSKYAVSTMEIHFEEKKLDFSMYENEDMVVINDAFKIFDSVYLFLYDNCIKFDSGETTHLAISSGISALRGEVKSKIVSVQNLINKSKSELSVVQEALIKLDEVLDQTIIKTIDNSSTSYSLKYSIASVVRIKYDMVKSF